ncbi:dienelactone hydrolase family protein [Raineya sp.]|jgi:carboxymethylenebutenolidase
MRKIFYLFLFCLLSEWAVAQTCCQLPSANTTFAQFAEDKEFQMSHLLPLPYTHISEIGKDITFKAADGTEAYAYELKAKQKSNKFILVFHEWWGLNDYIKKEAEKIYNDLEGKVTVIALDLYDKKVASTREEAAQFMQSAKKERIEAIIQGAFDYAGKKATFGTIGWCFGGGWSLQAAILAEKKAKACVIYYGMPEKDTERLKKLKAEVLGIFAGRERWISPAVVAEFEKNLISLKKQFSLQSFDAEHAFANPSNPNYNQEATQKAYQLTISFFRKKML